MFSQARSSPERCSPRATCTLTASRVCTRRGADAVWLVLPNGPVRSVVVFGHGWKLTPYFPGHPWVDQFRPWLDHLAAGGSAVIFPNYQLGSGDAGDVTRVQDFAAAIRTGYIRLGRPKVPFVAVGYSFGASLAFYYGANARMESAGSARRAGNLSGRHDRGRAVAAARPICSGADPGRRC